MNTQEKHIVQLFHELDDNQKFNCLRLLQFNADPSKVITRFAERHQKVHKSNISFYSISTQVTEGVVLTHAGINTAFGKFTGVGRTTNEARFFAVRNAESCEYSMLTEIDKEIPDLAPLAKAETYDPFGVWKVLSENVNNDTYSKELSY